jgi:hypothetical protein
MWPLPMCKCVHQLPFMIHGCLCVSWEGKKGIWLKGIMWMGFGMSIWVGS